jgi:hypothetical protein
MTPAKITGWLTYAAAAALIAAGLVLMKTQFIEGAKWALLGAAFIGLRRALAKVLTELDFNRRTLADLRAAIETELARRQI